MSKTYSYNRWNSVVIMHTSWAYVLFHMHFRLQTAIFDFSLTLTSSCTKIRLTMLFDVKDMRIPLKFHIYPICNVRFKCFQFHVRHSDFRWTRIEFCTGRCCYQQWWLRHPKNKRRNVEFASKSDLRPLIQWSSSSSHFYQQIIHLNFTSGDVIR